ncbi:MAG: methylmalonyl-CoA mutase [Acidobacteria bacterium]|nr:MAG: methylmalonyl-CoA mutase [Acidobacteriota bacterium]
MSKKQTISDKSISNKAEWTEEILTPHLATETERRAAFTTSSGLPLERLYASEDWPPDSASPAEKLGYPGAFPFTRGITPTMYRSQFWVMGMYSGYGSAEEANERYRTLLDRGQTGFSIALDLPTQCGYDADHSLAAGEVGVTGVHIGSLADMERLFEGIPLERVRQIRTTANAIGPIIAAMYIAAFEKQGVNIRNTRMFIQNDVLKEYFARGTYIFPPEAAVKLSSDVIEYCARNLPAWTPLAMSGYHIRDRGSTATQELAFTFANGLAYLDQVCRRGMSIDTFGPQIWTFLSAGIDVLEEVAKFRAARRIWARLMRTRYGAQNPETMKLKIFAYTLGGNLVAQQPLNNIARVAIETLAAVLGGVQTIATSSYDEAYAIPTEDAATIALRTQQIVAHEAGVTATIDALGGSYAIESLTDTIEADVFSYLDKIEALGGAVRCIEEGFYDRELSEAAYRYQRQIEMNERIMVGLNAYKSEEEQPIPVFRANPETEQRQIEGLRLLRQQRDNRLVAKTLADLAEQARANENLLPALIETVKAYATVGEICDQLRTVYGVYQPSHVF